MSLNTEIVKLGFSPLLRVWVLAVVSDHSYWTFHRRASTATKTAVRILLTTQQTRTKHDHPDEGPEDCHRALSRARRYSHSCPLPGRFALAVL